MPDFAATRTQDTPSYVPSPTVEDFILSVRNGTPDELRVLILQGSRGEGKTTAGAAAFLSLAERLSKVTPELLPLRIAVIRDSWVNLSRTTVESLRDFGRKGMAIEWRDSGRQALMGFTDTPLVHYHFFGLDRPADADKLQGFECSAIWLEEVAPAADLSAGIPAEAFGLGVTSLRQRGVPKRVVVTMNPPDQDAWILHVEELLDEMDLGSVRVRRWAIPPGEKERHFRYLASLSRTEAEAQGWTQAADEFKAYRDWCDAALTAIGRRDLAGRLVGGEVGEIRVGEPVASTFVRALHVVDELEPMGSQPIVRLWDGGGCPSCVIGQAVGENGRAGFNVLASHTMLNTPLDQFIREWVLPTMSDRGIMPVQGPRGAYGTGGAPRRRAWTYRDIGDPSMVWEGGTVKAENTSGRVIQETLAAALEPGPVDWDSRREALLSAFHRPGHERARFVAIDKRDNALLIQALAGRFRYPKDLAPGRITMTVQAAKRASGPKFSGVPDALAYGLAMLYPAAEWVRQTLLRPVPKVRRRSWLVS